MKIINRSDYDIKEIKRLTRIVLSRMKKSFIMPDLQTLKVESYDSSRWEGRYDGGASITVRLGRKVRYPNNWDKLCELPTWEDLYVGLLCWCLMLQYQRALWLKRPEDERKDKKKVKKYRRADCQEITLRFLKHWRVDDAYNLIMEKVNVDGEAPGAN